MRYVYNLIQWLGIIIIIYPFTAKDIFGFRRYGDVEVIMILLIGIIICAIGGILYSKETRRVKEEKLLVSCPYCAEKIRAKANVCKHCGRELNAKLVK